MRLYLDRKEKRKQLYQAMTTKVKRNPMDWKWRLVLMLTGGEIEVVPLLPRRTIQPHEILVVKLGQEGALNTAGVKMPTVSELVEVDLELLAPETFVAIDVDTPTTGPQRVVGTVVSVGGSILFLHRAGSAEVVSIAHDAIVKAYWAPVGYRA